MKIVILGNMGYVGPGVVSHLRSKFPTATINGFDTGFFSNCLTHADYLPERKLDQQYFGDIRNFPDELLRDTDVVINLAAISNDPMGKRFEKITMDVNYAACIKVANKARAMGVKSFVFASSCSVYGAEGRKSTEDSNVNPLTAYARSKVYAERDLRQLADEDFTITCLRFGTACGMSDRLRLDLVLNDFVACALSSKQITILSDGTPWRPLINVKDMALAMEWAAFRPSSSGSFMAINTGSEEWNFQVKQLAEAVAFVIPDVEVSLSTEVLADRRSYEVDFGLYKILAPFHQPRHNLLSTIKDLKEGLQAMKFKDKNFKNSMLIRLNVLTAFQEKGLIGEDLRWKFENQPVATTV